MSTLSTTTQSTASRTSAPLMRETYAPASGAPGQYDIVWWHGFVLAACAGVLLAAAVLDVRGETQVRVPVLGFPIPELCYWRVALGVPCPGCGLTRCFISMAHGQLDRAWHFNPAGVALFGALVFQFPYRGWRLWRWRRGLSDRAPTWVIYAGAAILPALFAQWIWRFLV